MSHGKQEPMESGRYYDIIIATSSSWRHCLFAFTKMADSQNYRQKYTWLLPSIYTHFGLILTCNKNDIVLHVYFNPKCNENWRKAAYHASSDWIQRVVQGWIKCGSGEHRFQEMTRKIEEIVTLGYEEKIRGRKKEKRKKRKRWEKKKKR